MSGEDPTSVPSVPGLPSDVAALLADARAVTPPSDAARDRLRARLASALPPSPSGGGGGGGQPGAPPSALTRAGAGAGWGARAPWWAVAAAFVIGAGVGRTVLPNHATELQVETRPTTTAAIATVTVNPAAAASGAPAVAAPAVELPATAVSSLADSPIPAPSGGARPIAPDLAAERQLLEVARTALGRGNGSDALAAADEHARRFPRGALGEEREAIAVQALVDSDRIDDARARGARFERTWPKSILLPTVRAALERR